jgi:hypothetical protein
MQEGGYEMSMFWNDLDEHDSKRVRFRKLPQSSEVDDKSLAPALKDELYDLWELSYWKKRQWTEISPFNTHASGE